MFRRKLHVADLEREIKAHLELLAAEHVRRGLSATDAREAAWRDFLSRLRHERAQPRFFRFPFR